MIGNNRNPNLGSVGVRFGEDHEVTINQKKEFNKKFKLNRSEKASTGRYIRVASNLLDK